jgi:uncharacterized protein YceH (UPF0502 family)
MYSFEDLEAVHSALHHLIRREPPLAKVLPRQPGTKESRYMHLFSGDTLPESETDSTLESESPRATVGEADGQRIAQLESEILELRRELETLRGQFAAFQKQFQ